VIQRKEGEAVSGAGLEERNPREGMRVVAPGLWHLGGDESRPRSIVIGCIVLVWNSRRASVLCAKKLWAGAGSSVSLLDDVSLETQVISWSLSSRSRTLLWRSMSWGYSLLSSFR
jgi:hypothetical protein